MSTPGFEKSDDEELLKLLTGGMRVLNDFGAEADAEHTNAERVIWIPGAWSVAALKFEPADGDGIAEHGRIYTVSLYAPTLGELQRLYRALYRELDNALSWTGFEMGKDAPKPRGGDLAARGWGIAPTVKIKGPVYRQVWVPGTSTTTESGIVLTDANGQNGQALP